MPDLLPTQLTTTELELNLPKPEWAALISKKSQTPALWFAEKFPPLRLMEPQLSPVVPLSFTTMPSNTIVSPALKLLPLMVTAPFAGLLGPAPADKVVGLNRKRLVAAVASREIRNVSAMMANDRFMDRRGGKIRCRWPGQSA